MQVNSEGAPTTVASAARRSQILAATIEVLAEQGWRGATYARICEHAGLSSQRLISYHFAGKDELLLQVVRSVYRAGDDYIRPQVLAEDTAPARLAAYLRANLEFLRDHRREMSALLEVVLNIRSGEGVLQLAGGREGLTAMVEAIGRILHQGQQDGDFRRFDVPTMARLIRHAIDGVNQQAALDPEFDFVTCTDELLTTFEQATRAGDRS